MTHTRDSIIKAPHRSRPRAFVNLRNLLLAGSCGLAMPGVSQGVPTSNTSGWTTRGFEVFGSAGDGDEGELYTLHLGMEFDVHDAPAWFTLAPQALLGQTVNTDDVDSALLGVDIMGRATPHRDDTWRWFVEGGVGGQYVGPESYPRRGSHANLRFRLGVGGEYRFNETTSFIGGVNWLHISNAGILSPNNGHDGPMVYLGLRWAF